MAALRGLNKHLFPNAKIEVEDHTVDKFVAKYSNWLSKRDDTKNNVEKLIDKSVIRKILTKELMEKRKCKHFYFSKV